MIKKLLHIHVDAATFPLLPSFIQDAFKKDGTLKKPSDIRSYLLERTTNESGIPIVHSPMLVGLYPTLLSPNSKQLFLDDDLSNYEFSMLTVTDPVIAYLSAISRSLNAIDKQNANSLIFTTERPYRLDTLQWLVSQNLIAFNNPEKCLIDAWMDTEFPYSSKSDWGQLFYKYKMTNEVLTDDRKKFDKLDSRLTIYRGTSDKEEVLSQDWGLSWTTNPKTAKYFSNRFSRGTAQVIKATIAKSDCLAFITGRNENEIIPDTSKITLQKIYNLNTQHYSELDRK